MIDWACTPLRAWCAFSSAGPGCAYRPFLLSLLHKSTLNSSLKSEAPFGRYGWNRLTRDIMEVWVEEKIRPHLTPGLTFRIPVTTKGTKISGPRRKPVIGSPSSSLWDPRRQVSHSYQFLLPCLKLKGFFGQGTPFSYLSPINPAS